jgi:hypothetical protein
MHDPDCDCPDCAAVIRPSREDLVDMLDRRQELLRVRIGILDRPHQSLRSLAGKDSSVLEHVSHVEVSSPKAHSAALARAIEESFGISRRIAKLEKVD